METGTRPGAGTGTRTSKRMRTRAGMGGKRSGNGDESRDEAGGEREPGNLRSCKRGGSEDARGGAAPTSNQQPQLAAARPDAPARLSHHAKGQSSGTGGEGHT